MHAASLFVSVLVASSAWAADPFAVTTPGKPGGAGVVPILSGEGPALPGSDNTLRLTRARPDSSATLVLGLSEGAAPFQGGVLGPAPDWLFGGLPVDGDGRLELPFVLPADAPVGLALWTQFWVADPTASAGLSASNTLTFAVASEAPPVFDGSSAVVSPVGVALYGLVLPDLDGDGLRDAVSTVLSSDALQVALGTGGGSFVPLQQLGAPGVTGPAVHADLDGDGDQDVIAPALHADAVLVCLGVGDGTLAAPVARATADLPELCVVGDLDGDGVPDLVTDSNSTVAVLIGRGGGDFHPPQEYATAFLNSAAGLGDLDADGDLDVVATAYAGTPGRALVLLGDGAGGLQPAGSHVVGHLPSSVALVDLDLDGHLDVVVADHSSSEDDVWTLRGDGTGQLGPALGHDVPGASLPFRLVTGDVDADGVPDVLLGHHAGLALLRGAGDGALCPAEATAGVSQAAWGHALADLDGDRRDDVALVEHAPDGLRVLFNQTP